MKVFSDAILLAAGLALAKIATAKVTDKRSEARAVASQAAGGLYGEAWDDHSQVVEEHKRIASVKVVGCGAGDHVNAIEIGFRDNHSIDPDIHDTVHSGGQEKLAEAFISLKQDEYVTSVKVTTFKKKVRVGNHLFSKTEYHDRIGSIEMATSKNQKLKCGSAWSSDPVVDLTRPGALLYFSGRAGANIDMLTAHWIPVEDF